jgi:Protein of unknown function (DUF3043)
MLNRRSSVKEAPTEEAVEETTPVAGKGRPTPKRSDARKARRNVTPKNRKEAAALQRERSREERKLARQALVTGDERHLPARDAGPEKRLARDVVDSRFSFGQVLFGLIFGSFALAFVPNYWVRAVANLVAIGSLALIVLDGARVGRRAKEAVALKYGDNAVRGISTYAFMRAFLPKRFRRPPPRVARGDQVL